MDNVKLILNKPVSVPSGVENLKKTDLATEEKKIKFAKDFESLLINKLMDTMTKTVGDWGFEKDGSSQQIQGIFSMYLSKDLGANGGLGLWKEIYNSLKTSESAQNSVQILDRNI